ncbi:methylenetetrahydrofolate reductase (NADH) 2-like [Typha latifolia]|uniref:methylenetetrahydrofolate reductase (NADH) 2-like n=1 Tax=Typha latifolia TaxID=4733 RepID=UPI003C2FCB9F
MKVIDKIKSPFSSSDDDTGVVFSFEFFTPKVPTSSTAYSRERIAGSFLAKVAWMAAHGAAFCDITWRPRDGDNTVDLAGRMQTEVGVDTMMHLTCLSMPLARIDAALDTARSRGVRNILALRGDPVDGDGAGDGEGGPTCALDLVAHIRSRHGDYFGIAVAGYPEAHPSKIPDGSEVATEEGYESDLTYLKRKVDAGADLIITQLFFDTAVFIKFVSDCRRIGIECPIVPGILPISSYRSFSRMTDMCKTRVPREVREAVEERKGDEAALVAYGVELAANMCGEILGHGVRALHFYTMNREEPAVAVLRKLGLVGHGENGVAVMRMRSLGNGNAEKGGEERKKANGFVL